MPPAMPAGKRCIAGTAVQRMMKHWRRPKFVPASETSVERTWLGTVEWWLQWEEAMNDVNERDSVGGIATASAAGSAAIIMWRRLATDSVTDAVYCTDANNDGPCKARPSGRPAHLIALLWATRIKGSHWGASCHSSALLCGQDAHLLRCHDNALALSLLSQFTSFSAQNTTLISYQFSLWLIYYGTYFLPVPTQCCRETECSSVRS